MYGVLVVAYESNAEDVKQKMSDERTNGDKDAETEGHFFNRLSNFIDKYLQEVRVSWKKTKCHIFICYHFSVKSMDRKSIQLTF